jgi:hypothetical protein
MFLRRPFVVRRTGCIGNVRVAVFFTTDLDNPSPTAAPRRCAMEFFQDRFDDR